MEEDVFLDSTSAFQSTHSVMSAQKQSAHLMELLTDASKLVASLQFCDSIVEVQTPVILNLLNNIVTPITQLPLLSTLENPNKLQEDLNAIQANMAAMSSHTAHVTEAL